MENEGLVDHEIWLDARAAESHERAVQAALDFIAGLPAGRRGILDGMPHLQRLGGISHEH